MSVDAQRLQEFVSRLYFGMTIPAILVAAIVIIYCYIGPAAFSSVIVIVLSIPATGIGVVCGGGGGGGRRGWLGSVVCE